MALFCPAAPLIPLSCFSGCFSQQIRLLFLKFPGDIINSIEEMKNMTKMIRDHKRLVLGSTGKNSIENKGKENIDFQNYLRSRSYTIKAQEDLPREPPRIGRCSLGKMEPLLSDPRRPSIKTRTEESHQHSKHFTTHIQKREKLTLNNLENTPPPPQKSREVSKGKPVQRLFEASEDSSLDSSVLEMLAHMRQHSILATAGETHFSISRDHLKELLSNSIAWTACMHTRSAPPKCACPQLHKIMAKMMEKIEKDFRETRRKALKMDSCTIKLAVFQEESQLAKVCESKIMKLKQQEQQLEDEVQKLTKYEQTVKSECILSQAMVEKKKRQLQELHIETHKEQAQLYRLHTEVKSAQKEYHRFVEIENKVKNFIEEQQNNKIVKAIFQEYKQIEADIYDYASYLQSNQLASDLFYEPHPFRAIEEQIEQQLKSVNVLLIQGKDHTVEEKCVVMRDFVLQSMGKFKKKDEQMGKVIEFRTKCIHRFIENMKKWLNNWEFKQEFLVNLRKEFAYDSNLLIENIQKVVFSPENEAEAAKIKELTKKIIENYELGNSFY